MEHDIFIIISKHGKKTKPTYVIVKVANNR